MNANLERRAQESREGIRAACLALSESSSGSSTTDHEMTGPSVWNKGWSKYGKY